jgi:hypothetical protein
VPKTLLIDTRPRVPKVKCCTSKPKCARCPLRMMAEGTLPDGYVVKKRRLVDPDGKLVKKSKKSGSAKRLRQAVRLAVKQRKRSRLPEAA